MTVKKPTPLERRQLVDAAMGRRPFDNLIKNVRLVNVFSGDGNMGSGIHAGIRAENPVMHIATVALPVILRVKITNRGLVDTEAQCFLNLFPTGGR